MRITPKHFFMPKGFTYIELLVAMVLIAIMATVAIPGFSALMTTTHASTAINKLLRLYHHGRHQAIEHGHFVTLCPSTTGKQCSKHWGHKSQTHKNQSSKSVDSGLLLFFDHNANQQKDTHEMPIYFLAMPDKGQYYSTQRAVTIYPQGTVKRGHRITWCPDSRNTLGLRQITINFLGRVQQKPRTEIKPGSC